MVEPRAGTRSERRRFVSLRRRIYQTIPDLPEDALPLVLVLMEQCAAGVDPAALLVGLVGGVPVDR